jgi:hypothetical protein
MRIALVHQLMAARRTIQAATDPADLRAARSRVDAAKRGLGERGVPWWEAPTREGVAGRLDGILAAGEWASMVWSRDELIAATHADQLADGPTLIDEALARLQSRPSTQNVRADAVRPR